jgi:hypothetical protein
MEKKEINCPICGCFIDLVEEYNDLHFPGIYDSIRVDFLSYKCDSCEESFTTTEVDEVNVSRVRNSIRNIKRINKIKNIIK